MLVLRRRPGQSLVFEFPAGDGDPVIARVKVETVVGGTVKFAIDAPTSVTVLRDELVNGRGGATGP